jgi:hypothetical protein
MDEDLAIINSNTRNQKIKDFFVSNKKSLIVLTSIIFIFLIAYFIFGEYEKIKKEKFQ